MYSRYSCLHNRMALVNCGICISQFFCDELTKHLINSLKNYIGAQFVRLQRDDILSFVYLQQLTRWLEQCTLCRLRRERNIFNPFSKLVHHHEYILVKRIRYWERLQKVRMGTSERLSKPILTKFRKRQIFLNEKSQTKEPESNNW